MKKLETATFAPEELSTLMTNTLYRALDKRIGNASVFRVVGYYESAEGNGLETREYQGRDEKDVTKKAIEDENGLGTLLMVECINNRLSGN
ncbi:MAG: hypothetical protein AABY03_02290 [Nanoarchaeota archaeon]|mgnify:CR=1 FL=1